MPPLPIPIRVWLDSNFPPLDLSLLLSKEKNGAQNLACTSHSNSLWVFELMLVVGLRMSLSVKVFIRHWVWPPSTSRSEPSPVNMQGSRFGGQFLSYGRKEKGIQKRLARGWSLRRWMSAGAKPLTFAENLFRVVGGRSPGWFTELWLTRARLVLPFSQEGRAHL